MHVLMYSPHMLGINFKKWNGSVIAMFLSESEPDEFNSCYLGKLSKLKLMTSFHVVEGVIDSFEVIWIPQRWSASALEYTRCHKSELNKNKWLLNGYDIHLIDLIYRYSMSYDMCTTGCWNEPDHLIILLGSVIRIFHQ